MSDRSKINLPQTAKEVEELINNMTGVSKVARSPNIRQIMEEELYVRAYAIQYVPEYFDLALRAAETLMANTQPENPIHCKVAEFRTKLMLVQAQRAREQGQTPSGFDLSKLKISGQYKQ